MNNGALALFIFQEEITLARQCIFQRNPRSASKRVRLLNNFLTNFCSMVIQINGFGDDLVEKSDWNADHTTPHPVARAYKEHSITHGACAHASYINSFESDRKFEKTFLERNDWIRIKTALYPNCLMPKILESVRILMNKILDVWLALMHTANLV